MDANQYTDAGPNGKGIGVEWGWEGTAPKILQDTAGVLSTQQQQLIQIKQ